MHILSLSDIQLIVDLYELQQSMANTDGREQQVDNLIRTGYLRPLRGVYALTELGEKTARSLQMKQFVPPRAPPAAPESAPQVAHQAADPVEPPAVAQAAPEQPAEQEPQSGPQAGAEAQAPENT